MVYQRPRPGQPLDFIESAALWSDIVDMLNDYQRGRGGAGELVGENSLIDLVNSTSNDRDFGEILQVDSAQMELGSGDSIYQFLLSPNIDAIDPIWHTKIDNLVSVGSGALASTGVFSWPRSWSVVKISTVTQTTDRYVMLDPSNVNQMKTSDAGIWKIIGLDNTNKFAVVDLGQSQPLWRYELTQASQQPSTTTAKLVRLDGTVYSTSINLSDPDGFMDDQVSGDDGFCIHCGNAFYAIQAVCA